MLGGVEEDMVGLAVTETVDLVLINKIARQ